MGTALPLPALPDAQVCVAFSGGLDSTVLLHRLASEPEVRVRGLRAWHVHHGLHAHADAWVGRCEAACAALGVPLTVSRVTVSREDGLGIEGAARRARRAAFAEGLVAGEVLALAHHRDDQAETFLLRALRASGPDGLAAMPAWRDFGRGHLWRPLLQLPRASLLSYATAHRLDWIEDPSNTDEAFDRNFLRHRVMPLLASRWPHAAAAMARSADLCGEAAVLLDAGDTDALQACGLPGQPALLSRAALVRLPPERRARVFRRWIAGLGLPPLPAGGVARIESELLPARSDATPRYAWAGAAVHAWRDLLHAARLQPGLPPDWQARWDGLAPLPLHGGGTLQLCPLAPTAGAERAAFDPPVIVHARRGGERITLPGRAHSHLLKHVLQDRGVPPWERPRMPLLSTPNGELLAAGDRVLSARMQAWLQERNVALAWRPA